VNNPAIWTVATDGRPIMSLLYVLLVIIAVLGIVWLIRHF
jgi:hypothetical protein